jgi:hypothetical protein
MGGERKQGRENQRKRFFQKIRRSAAPSPCPDAHRRPPTSGRLAAEYPGLTLSSVHARRARRRPPNAKPEGKSESAKRLPASTSALRVRVFDLKTLPLQPVVEVHARTTQVGRACRVQNHRHSLAFAALVPRFRLVERHPVLKPRAPARFHQQPQRPVLHSCLFLHSANLGRSPGRQRDHDGNTLRARPPLSISSHDSPGALPRFFIADRFPQTPPRT